MRSMILLSIMVFSIWNLAINEANAGLHCKVDLGGNKSVWHCRSQDLFFDASGQWETCAPKQNAKMSPRMSKLKSA